MGLPPIEEGLISLAPTLHLTVCMRLISFLRRQTDRTGAISGDWVIDLPKAQRALGERIPLSDPRIPIKMLPFLEGGSRVLLAARRTLREAARLDPDSPLFRGIAHRLNSVKLLAPIPYPRKNIICLGANYSDHALETGRAVPPHPVFFTKAPTAVIGPEEPITYHRCVKYLDYEVELAFIVGRKGRDIARRDAYKHIAGYTIMNDVSERGLQRRHEQWFKGKSLDTFAPMGPCLVTRD
ncbi:MAG: fumarylacetoacetate hydrolase family protein, partial [Aigarchaeota archaeon]|nr:fumarylacetoacetate hydrolase family protein [Aigarchaeota archaeon]